MKHTDRFSAALAGLTDAEIDNALAYPVDAWLDEDGCFEWWWDPHTGKG